MKVLSWRSLDVAFSITMQNNNETKRQYESVEGLPANAALRQPKTLRLQGYKDFFSTQVENPYRSNYILM
jgi:hypothetical protein